MSPELPRPYQELQTSRQILVDKIIEFSVKGVLTWDFTHFDNSVFGQMAEAKKAGFIFVSSFIQDEGIEFSVLRGENALETTEVDSFKGPEAERIREVLSKLAWLDEGFKSRKLDEIRNHASQELLNLEEFNTKKREVGVILELLAAT